MGWTEQREGCPSPKGATMTHLLTVNDFILSIAYPCFTPKGK